MSLGGIRNQLTLLDCDPKGNHSSELLQCGLMGGRLSLINHISYSVMTTTCPLLEVSPPELLL